MARPITETPTLYGKDAKRFAENMEKVENLTPEERRANRQELEKQYQEDVKKFNLTFLF